MIKNKLHLQLTGNWNSMANTCFYFRAAVATDDKNIRPCYTQI